MVEQICNSELIFYSCLIIFYSSNSSYIVKVPMIQSSKNRVSSFEEMRLYTIWYCPLELAILCVHLRCIDFVIPKLSVIIA